MTILQLLALFDEAWVCSAPGPLGMVVNVRVRRGAVVAETPLMILPDHVGESVRWLAGQLYHWLLIMD